MLLCVVGGFFVQRELAFSGFIDKQCNMRLRRSARVIAFESAPCAACERTSASLTPDTQSLVDHPHFRLLALFGVGGW